jgi:uncharacterized damage-inducible protein DinB
MHVMTTADSLRQAFINHFEGAPWHGSSLRAILTPVSAAQAVARPIPNGRTIAELLGHTIAWMEIVERRARGEAVEVTPEMDFPHVSALAWPDLLSRLDAAHARLLATLATLDDESLAKHPPGKEYTVKFMLQGLMHHNTYHSAQIALLRKFET